MIVNQHFGGKQLPYSGSALIAVCFLLLSCLAYISTLKIEATRSSELPVDFQQTLPRYALDQWYSTFFVRVPPDVIILQLCTPKVVGV
jgi:hypothetical protein